MKNEFTLAKAVIFSGIIKIHLGFLIFLVSVFADCFPLFVIGSACVGLGGLMMLGGMLARL